MKPVLFSMAWLLVAISSPRRHTSAQTPPEQFLEADRILKGMEDEVKAFCNEIQNA